MNNFTAIARVKNQPELRYTSDNQTPLTNAMLELVSRTGESFEITSVAFGKVAEKIAAMPPNTVLLVNGQLNILRVDRGGVKASIASLRISEAEAIGGQLISFNSISIVGNVGQDVDVKHFESGKNNAKFSVATRRTKDETGWFSVELWGATATIADRYVVKGSKVGVNGALKIETWTDRNTGEVRSKPVIVGERLSLIGRKTTDQDSQSYSQSNSQSTAARSSQPTATAAKSSAPAAYQEPDYDDIPF
jgi:single-strand DNA-binding protein